MTPSRPLKFCYLSIFYPPHSFGGDAICAYQLSDALARRGHEVDIIRCQDSYDALKLSTPVHGVVSHPRVTIHTLKSRWGVLSPLLSQQTGRPWLKTTQIRNVLESKKFDVIHYHNISLFGPKVLEIEPDYSGFVKAYTAHEHWLVCPMHTLWKNNQQLCDKPECFRCSLRFRRPPQWWRYTNLLDTSLSAVDVFLSPSRFSRDMHYQRGFGRRIEHLPFFVRNGPSTCADPPHHRPYFLFVGRLEKIKGLQEVIPIFREYPHADLLIAGSGSYERELRALSMGMQNIVFLGWISNEQLAQLYRHAIALLVPSICYEVFGLTVVEAFAQHTPVIVHALGGLQELVEESGGGYTYRTLGELFTHMERLRNYPELRQHLGDAGYNKYLERWSEEAHLCAYFKILENTARRKFGYVPWEKGGGGAKENCGPIGGA